MSKSQNQEWLALQKKIFTRWVNQKLASRKIHITDVVTGMNAVVLRDLLEVLSEKPYPGKRFESSTMRVKEIDNLNGVLDFAYKTLNVQLELKCSPENVLDHEEKPILALVWAIMQRFMTFGDEEESKKLSARDALLAWVNNQVAGYPGVHVENFTKSFHDGLALCALIHHFRPKLINFDELKAGDKEQNLKIAFDAAEKYFGLEQYLTPADIPKLDDKSMAVYVSEYYYGIAAQRRVDLAARRIVKLVKFTQVNDALRKDYSERAHNLLARIAKNKTALSDRVVDNTLNGAQAKIAEYHQYEAKEKSAVLSDFLALESVYTHLAMRLADHKRPAFAPETGLSLAELRAQMAELDRAEADRNAHLQRELHRQNHLHRLNGQHEARFNKLNAWVTDKQAYLQVKEEITSVGAAEFQLNRLSAFSEESATVAKQSFDDLKALGDNLREEKFEKASEVSDRETQASHSFERLAQLASEKKTVLDAELAREVKKEKLRVQFAALASKFDSWARDQAEALSRAVFFGFSLEEVKAAGAKLKDEASALEHEASQRREAYLAVLNEAKALGVTENVYTHLQTTDLDQAASALTSAIVARQEAYGAELARQEANDRLAQQFADLADKQFAAQLTKNKEDVTNSKLELEQQLEHVQRLIDDSSLANQLPELQRLYEETHKAAISNNYTVSTSESLSLLWQQYQSFLSSKKSQLEEAITQKRLRGITPEQMAEIESQFKSFDKNSNNVLDRSEFKACLYSLNDERSTAEVTAIMNQYGNGAGISLEGFREFMIHQLGDADTQDEILGSFKLINRDNEKLVDELSGLVIPESELAYIKANAPGGADYAAWTESVFSR